jgi:hypothetical protein
MTAPNDVRCTAVTNGDIDRGTRYDAERMWRWVIAILQDIQNGQDVALQVQQQIGDCPNCLRAVAGGLAGIISGSLIARGGHDAALKVAQRMLDEVLSSPDIINTEPRPE